MALDDSGHRADFDNGAMRERQPGKGRFDLLPPEALTALAKVFEDGALKYSDRNWEKGIPLSTCIDSGMRHIVKLMAGDESEDHAALCMANMAMFIALRDRQRKSVKSVVGAVVEKMRVNDASETHGWVNEMYRCGESMPLTPRAVGPSPHPAHRYGTHGNGMWCDGYV